MPKFGHFLIYSTVVIFLGFFYMVGFLGNLQLWVMLTNN